MASISVDEKRWREEDDARSLASAEEVKSDPKRLKAAKNRAAAMAKEKEKEIRAIKKVARGAAKPKNNPKPAKKATYGSSKRK